MGHSCSQCGGELKDYYRLNSKEYCSLGCYNDYTFGVLNDKVAPKVKKKAKKRKK